MTDEILDTYKTAPIQQRSRDDLKSVDQFIDGFMMNRTVGQLKDSTLTWYRFRLTKFKNFLDAIYAIEYFDLITRKHIRKYMEYLKDECKFCDATIAGYQRALIAFFNWAERVYAKPNPIRFMVPFSPMTSKRSCDDCDNAPGPVKLTKDTVKVDKDNREFMTGSVRDQRTGKGRMDLLPPRALREVAIHFEEGADKYGDRNWEQGQPLSVFIDSGFRHMLQVMAGKRDERHDRAMAWNVLCFLDTVERIRENLLPRELDDIGWLSDDEQQGKD